MSGDIGLPTYFSMLAQRNEGLKKVGVYETQADTTETTVGEVTTAIEAGTIRFDIDTTYQN